MPLPTEEGAKATAVWSEYGANLLSRLFFFWATPIIRAASRRPLELHDFPPLRPSLSSGYMAQQLKEQIHIFTAAGHKRPLLRAVREVYGWTFYKALLLAIIALFIDYANIVAFYFFWRYLQDGINARARSVAPPSFGRGIMWVGIICGVQLLEALCRIHAQYNSCVLDARVKTALNALIAEKSFSIDRLAQPQLEQGRPASGNPLESRTQRDSSSAMILIAVHAPRVGQLLTNTIIGVRYLFNIPCLAITLGYFMGWPTAIAIMTIVSALGVALFIFFHALAARRDANTLADKRIRHLQDMLTGIRLLKYFAWEDYFLKTSLELRGEEVRANRWATMWTTFFITVYFSAGNFASFAAFALFARRHSNFEGNAGLVFSGIIFLCFDRNLNEISRAIVAVLNSGPSISLITKYLMSKDHQELAMEQPDDDEVAIDLTDTRFAWSDQKVVEARHDFELPLVNIKVRVGELVAIVGPSKAGKTSLLAGMVGDMPLRSGKVRMGGQPAYFPQLGWIQSATVRDNIVLAQRYDHDVYNKVLDACALRSDLDAMPSGDMTELGENGIRLSGGQRARVTLARVVYQAIIDRRSIVLLDDPLSAVDASTSAYLFEKVMVGLLRAKTCILATHQLHVLSRCDRIIYMQHGRIEADGNFRELMRDHKGFADFVGSHGQSAVWQKAPRSSAAKIGEEQPSVIDTVMIEDEDKADLRVPWSLYYTFLDTASKKWQLGFNTILLIISQVAIALVALEAAWWAEDYWHIGCSGNTGLYALFVFLHVGTWSLYNYFAQAWILRTTQDVSSSAMSGILRAPMSFFDANPIGRILNRFTSDISELDTVLPGTFWRLTLQTFFAFATLGTFISYIPIMAAILVPWLALGALVFVIYKAAPLETKRISAQLSSRYLALAHEALIGRTTIKLSMYEKGFLDNLYTCIDDFNSVDLLSLAIFSSTSFAHNVTYMIMMFCAGALLLQKRFDYAPATGVLVYALLIVTASVQQSWLENGTICQKSVNSLERLKHYATSIPQEDVRHADEVRRHDLKRWPRNGVITFEGVNMRYKDSLPFVLKDLDLTINEREKIGIVGRTGAGKSSLIAVILRLVEITNGRVTIDGTDIRHLGLHDIRQAIATIPQDPMLFVGDVRKNMDPTGCIDDTHLKAALKQVNLPEISLEDEVEPRGENFSAGEKQLLSLARALARQDKIILIDEATSNVDIAKDHEIQRTIRNVFADCTIMTIAHRIRTVVEYDRIVVLEEGRIAEVGPPKELFNKGGLFRALCDQACIMLEDFAWP